MIGIGERHIKGIRLGFQIDCLPRASAGCWNASGYASTQANAEYKDKDKIDGGRQQSIHDELAQRRE